MVKPTVGLLGDLSLVGKGSLSRGFPTLLSGNVITASFPPFTRHDGS